MKRAGLAAIAVVLICAAIVIYARRAEPVVMHADFAVSQVYVELATRGELQLGPYSRFGWHHPGPIYFYLIAPFYAAAGHQAAAMYAVALAINLLSLAAIGWMILRESRSLLAAATIAALLFYAWRADGFLASPWNAHVAILPAMAALTIAAAVAAGRASLLPLLVVFASMAVQTHVGFAPTLLIICGLAAAIALVTGRPGGQQTRAFVVAAVLAVLLWLPSIVEAAANGGGNAGALWRFFIEQSEPPKSMRDALRYGGYGLSSLLRPDVDLNWSDRVQVLDSFRYVFGVLVAGLLLAVAAWRDWTSRRRFDAAFAIVCLAATAIGVWGLTRVRGPVLHYDTIRLAPLGAIDAAIIVVAMLRLALERYKLAATPLLASSAVLVLLAAGGWLGLRHLASPVVYALPADQRRATAAYEAVRNYLDRERITRPLFRIGRDRWPETASALAVLLRDGRRIALPDEHLYVFTPAFKSDGTEDATIWFADQELHRQLAATPGTQVLLESFPLFVDGIKKQ